MTDEYVQVRAIECSTCRRPYVLRVTEWPAEDTSTWRFWSDCGCDDSHGARGDAYPLRAAHVEDAQAPARGPHDDDARSIAEGG